MGEIVERRRQNVSLGTWQSMMKNLLRRASVGAIKVSDSRPPFKPLSESFPNLHPLSYASDLSFCLYTFDGRCLFMKNKKSNAGSGFWLFLLPLDTYNNRPLTAYWAACSWLFCLLKQIRSYTTIAYAFTLMHTPASSAPTLQTLNMTSKPIHKKHLLNYCYFPKAFRLSSGISFPLLFQTEPTTSTLSLFPSSLLLLPFLWSHHHTPSSEQLTVNLGYFCTRRSKKNDRRK